jgi:DNA-binding NarL/FixJ family response regulator
MSCRIVIADDSEDDLFLFRRALKRISVPLELLAELSDGEQVLAYLKGQGYYADRDRFPLPNLLILDIKMPRTNGLEVLEWLQTQHFPGMKVIMLSSSSLESDIATAKRLNAHAYLAKSADQAILVETIESLVVPPARKNKV